MKLYETMFVLKPTLTPEETAARVQFIRDVIKNGGGEISAENEMGNRKLAYKVDNFERGYYFVIYFKAEGKTVLELERIYKITEDFIKFIIVKYEKQVELKAWNNLVDKVKKTVTNEG